MPTLKICLREHDLVFLQMVANLWGIELAAPDAATARITLIEVMSNSSVAEDMLESLPQDARDGFNAIVNNAGHMAWLKFIREYGDVRVMGASRRDRERPDLQPSSAAEMLWYRALIGRAFMNINNEPQEYAYIPEEILALVKSSAAEDPKIALHPVESGLVGIKVAVNDDILNDFCSILAALRVGLPESQMREFLLKGEYPFLLAMLKSMGLVDKDGKVETEAARLFLEMPRAEALSKTFAHWVGDKKLNEMHHLPGLVIEGVIDNNPRQNRSFLLEQIMELETGVWWNIDEFIEEIYKKEADFMRPTGNYGTWFIRAEDSEEFMIGFAYWHKIEGAYLRFLINGPLHWFGILETGQESKIAPSDYFKLSDWAHDLADEKTPPDMEAANDKAQIDRLGKVTLSKGVPMALRYQISRFCDWEAMTAAGYNYKITTTSLEKAAGQSLRPAHLTALLLKASGQPLPQQVKDALEHWDKHGTESRITKEFLLKVTNAEIITQLLASSSRKLIKEILTPNAVILVDGSEEKIRQAIADLGYLSDWAIL